MHAYLRADDPEPAMDRALADLDKVARWGFQLPPAILLSPLVEGDEESFNLALVDALEAHRDHFSVADRGNDADAAIDVGILALTCHARRRGWRIRVSSPYLPHRIPAPPASAGGRASVVRHGQRARRRTVGPVSSLPTQATTSNPPSGSSGLACRRRPRAGSGSRRRPHRQRGWWHGAQVGPGDAVPARRQADAQRTDAAGTVKHGREAGQRRPDWQERADHGHSFPRPAPLPHSKGRHSPGRPAGHPLTGAAGSSSANVSTARVLPVTTMTSPGWTTVSAVA
ncbi:immunity 49 family protein [Streptomyces spinoverrucosus]|uniref:immunity 49 family protein n=1 Tax=Streptomyces spinoverrucosus TaxID=284043 RepID=UPI0027DA33C9|nr:immunity 49 family protein [Streptomyces spinoverrucosus]